MTTLGDFNKISELTSRILTLKDMQIWALKEQVTAQEALSRLEKDIKK